MLICVIMRLMFFNCFTVFTLEGARNYSSDGSAPKRSFETAYNKIREGVSDGIGTIYDYLSSKKNSLKKKMTNYVKKVEDDDYTDYD